MRKRNFFWIVFLSLIGVFIFNEAQGEDIIYTLQVEWSFAEDSVSPPLVVSGYKLYREGTPLITWAGATTKSGEVITSLPANTYSNFTLTAVFSDGSESPHSAEYPFNPGATKPASPFNFHRVASMFGKLFKLGNMQVRTGILGGGLVDMGKIPLP